MKSKKVNIEEILANQMTIPNKLLTSYASLGLNETEVLVLLQIYRFIQTGNDFPTLDELTNYLTLSKDDCSKIIRTLIQKNYLSIRHVKNDQYQISEAYSLSPLWEKLFIHEDAKVRKEHDIGTIFILFEQEFGRPLSPFEIETINHWLDEDVYAPEIIKAALREAVLMSKLNFKYIDRILRNWENKGIKTVEQARAKARSFRDHQSRQIKQGHQLSAEDKSLLNYNWIEDGD